MAVIGWARVSSKTQSLDTQMEALGKAQCDEVFAHKHSGKGNGKNIEELNEMLRFVRKGDVVVTTKLDRLGRSLKEVLQTIDAIKGKGASLKVLEQPVDTSKDDAFSNAMLQLLGVFAEMERSFIKERTQSGKERTGNYGGRKKTLTNAQRESIRNAVNEGATQYSLAKEYGVTQTTIHRIVHKEVA